MTTLSIVFYATQPNALERKSMASIEAMPELSILSADSENLGGGFSQALSQSSSDWLLFLDARRQLHADSFCKLMSALKNEVGKTDFCVARYKQNSGQVDCRVESWNRLQHVDLTERVPVVFSRRAIVTLGGFRETFRFRPLYDLMLRAAQANLLGKRLEIELASSMNAVPTNLCRLQLGRYLESLDEGLKISQAHYGRVSSRWALRIGRHAANLAGLSRSSSLDYDREVLRIAKAYGAAPDWRKSMTLLCRHFMTEAKAILKSPKNVMRLLPSRLKNRWQEYLGRRIFQLGYHESIPCRLPATNHTNRKRPTSVPSISITTPSLNQGATLERTIQSVLSQNYPKLEYTVQDGGSNDNSLAVLQQYDEQLTHWVSKTDRGQADAIVRGFEGTSGEIMAYLNSDDVLLPGALDFVGCYFARHPDVDVIYGDRVLIDDQNHEINRWYLPKHDDEAIVWADYIPQETMFWRRRAWDAVGGIDPSFQFAMDWDLILRFRRAKMRFVHIPKLLGAFRISDHQKTNTLLATYGYREMCQLRRRELGYIPTEEEVAAYVRNYIRKQRVVSGWRFLSQRWTVTQDWTANVAEVTSARSKSPSIHFLEAA